MGLRLSLRASPAAGLAKSRSKIFIKGSMPAKKPVRIQPTGMVINPSNKPTITAFCFLNIACALRLRSRKISGQIIK